MLWDAKWLYIRCASFDRNGFDSNSYCQQMAGKRGLLALYLLEQLFPSITYKPFFFHTINPYLSYIFSNPYLSYIFLLLSLKETNLAEHHFETILLNF